MDMEFQFMEKSKEKFHSLDHKLLDRNEFKSFHCYLLYLYFDLLVLINEQSPFDSN